MKMRRFAGTLLAMALLAQPLGADILDNVCEGTFGVWGQATYLKPTQGDRAYAVQSPFVLQQAVGDGPIKTRSVCLDYEWGFEVGGIYLTRCCDTYASVAGGWNEFNGTNRIVGTLLPLLQNLFSPSPTTIGEGYASLKSEYWYVDGRIGHIFQQCCNYQLHAFVGVRYIDLSERLFVAFTGIDGAVSPDGQATRQRDRSSFNGTGPEIGFGGRFCVWRGLSIRGDLAVAALIGTRKHLLTSFQVATAPTFNFFPNAQCSGIVPGIDMKAGVNWSACYCKMKAGVEIGYKAHQYFYVYNETSIGDFQGTTRRNAGFAGPYISLSAAY